MALTKKNIIIIIVVTVLVLLVAGASIFAYFYFLNNGEKYIIENKYYGFEIKTPEKWIAAINTDYSEENIAEVIDECKNGESGSSYEIGAFKFGNKKYINDSGDVEYALENNPSAAFLDITIDCIPEEVANNLMDYNYGNAKISGERAFEEIFDMPGFDYAKHISLFHNGLKYKINEYIYISAEDQANKEKIKAEYIKAFDRMVSGLKLK